MPDDAKAVYLHASSLAVARGGRLLIAALDVVLQPGEAMVLIGPNGIGKSSLLRAFAGLLPLYSGRLDRAGAIGFADQSAALDAQSTLRRALSFWATIDHRRADAEMHVDAALAALNLTALAEFPTHMLSTGQKRRAGLARLLVRNADIWLLDEPANGLDSDSLARLGTAMAAHRACGGIVIAASHQPLPLERAQTIDLSAYARRAEP